MRTNRIERQDWKNYCNRISKALTGKRAEIEVASLALGGQVAAEWLPLYGITYDPKDDLVEVALEGLDHLIARPQELYAVEGPGGVESLEIVDGDGNRQIIRLRDPFMLPAVTS